MGKRSSMKLADAIRKLDLMIEGLPHMASMAITEAANNFISDVRIITPFRSGDMSEDWQIVRSKVTLDGAELAVETHPIHNGDDYASKIEMMYRTRIGPGDRDSLNFHRRTEDVYQLKADDVIRKHLEASLKKIYS